MHAILSLLVVAGFSLITAADILHHVPQKVFLLKTVSRLIAAGIAIANLYLLISR